MGRRPPRRAEASAETSAMPAATPKTMVSPWWKGPETSLGKKV
ncbi:hypothetical protein ACFRDV_02070 [Streptomyces fagopyri]